jgi:cytochrome b involved in lipid metabolism
MSKTFSKDAVASHNKGDSLWIVIDEDVYDVTKFQDEHPGKFFRSRKKIVMRRAERGAHLKISHVLTKIC